MSDLTLSFLQFEPFGFGAETRIDGWKAIAAVNTVTKLTFKQILSRFASEQRQISDQFNREIRRSQAAYNSIVIEKGEPKDRDEETWYRHVSGMDRVFEYKFMALHENQALNSHMLSTAIRSWVLQIVPLLEYLYKTRIDNINQTGENKWATGIGLLFAKKLTDVDKLAITLDRLNHLRVLSNRIKHNEDHESYKDLSSLLRQMKLKVVKTNAPGNQVKPQTLVESDITDPPPIESILNQFTIDLIAISLLESDVGYPKGIIPTWNRYWEILGVDAKHELSEIMQVSESELTVMLAPSPSSTERFSLKLQFSLATKSTISVSGLSSVLTPTVVDNLIKDADQYLHHTIKRFYTPIALMVSAEHR